MECREGLPGHDIVGNGRSGDASGGIGLHALCDTVTRVLVAIRTACFESIGAGGRSQSSPTLKSRINRRRAAVDMAQLFVEGLCWGTLGLWRVYVSIVLLSVAVPVVVAAECSRTGAPPAH